MTAPSVSETLPADHGTFPMGEAVRCAESPLLLGLPRALAENLIWGGVIAAVLCLHLIFYGDRAAILALSSLNRGVVHFFKPISAMGNSVFYLVPTAVGFLGAFWASTRPSFAAFQARLRRFSQACLFVFVAIAGSGLVNLVFKMLFGRPRPSLFWHEGLYHFQFFEFTGHCWSFPSGHANTMFALATAMSFLAPRSAYVLFPLACLVAAGRFIVGSHYPGDLVAGAYLGILTTFYLRQYFLSKKIAIFG